LTLSAYHAIFFSSKAPLQKEYDRMFASLYTNAETMKRIIKAIGSKNKGITRAELVEITGMPNLQIQFLKTRSNMVRTKEDTKCI